MKRFFRGDDKIGIIIAIVVVAIVLMIFFGGCGDNQQGGFVCDGVDPEGWTLQDSLNSLPPCPIKLDSGWQCPVCDSINRVIEQRYQPLRYIYKCGYCEYSVSMILIE